MKKSILFLMFTIVSFLFFSSISAAQNRDKSLDSSENLTSSDAEDVNKNIEATMVLQTEYPKGFSDRHCPLLTTNRAKPVKKFSKSLEHPQDLIDPVFGEIKIDTKVIPLIFAREKDGEKYIKFYMDSDGNNKFNETPIISKYALKKPHVEFGYFNKIIKIKNKPIMLFIMYYKNISRDLRTDKIVIRETINWGISQTFKAKFTIKNKDYQVAFIDKKADNQISLTRQNDLGFFDINRDSIFNVNYPISEMIATNEIIIGEWIYTFEIDVDKMKLFLKGRKIEYGYIVNKIPNLQNPKLLIAKGTQNNALPITVELNKTKSKAPAGRWLIRSLIFEKNNKKYQLYFRSFSRNDSIVISKDKPYEFSLDLEMKFRIEKYSKKGAAKKTYRISGNVYNKKFKTSGKSKREILTRVEITKMVVKNGDEYFEEYAPPYFILKDGAGKIFSQNKGYDFC